MSRAKGLAVVMLAAAATCVAQSNASPELPAGAIQKKVSTACTECHESRIIVQQRLSRAAWVKEVDKMIKWGALVDPADHDAFVDYLSSNFSPNKPPFEAPKVKAGQ